MLLRREDVQRNWNPHNDSLLLNYLPWPMPMNFPIILCGGTKTCMEFIWCTTYSIFVQFGIFNYRSTWKFLFDTSSWPIKNIVKDIAIPCKKVNRKSGDVRFLKEGVAVDRSNISASKKSAESFRKFYGTNQDFIAECFYNVKYGLSIITLEVSQKISVMKKHWTDFSGNTNCFVFITENF